ncbi:MAG: gluconate 2-dehydrogenase subunit 3 family protein [Gemmatimonadota bacterium]|nr:gluconate 2-dehydrogenase subunit 3 family protein [Gemmatimonadota bacterium]
MTPMDRRTALRTLIALTGLQALTPEDRIQAVEARRVLGCLTPPASRVPLALTPHELDLVGAVADIILPRTESPGATDVGVPAFIDLMVAEWLDEEQSRTFRHGLEALDESAGARFGRPFLAAHAGQRETLVSELDTRLATPLPDGAAPDFYRWMKRLTVTGYFTSEEGASLTGYRIVPGAYEGCAVAGDGR